MAAKAKKKTNDDFIVRGDDGKLYRVSRKAMHARPVKGSESAAKKHKAALHELAGKVQEMSGPHAFACIIAFAETAGPGAAKRD